MDEICGTGSRFPAGFLPMRMFRWFPSGNCRQGWGCMFAHDVNELHPQDRGQGWLSFLWYAATVDSRS